MFAFLFLIFNTLYPLQSQIKAYKFDKFWVVFVRSGRGEKEGDFRKAIARWEENKGYVWIDTFILPEDVYVLKTFRKIIFIDENTDYKHYRWDLKIYNILTENVTRYYIKTKIYYPHIKKIIKINELGDTLSYSIHGPPIPSYQYLIAKNRLFFMLHGDKKEIKHEEFKVYKMKNLLKSFYGNVLCYDIKGDSFFSADSIIKEKESFDKPEISISSYTKLSLYEKLFVFDKLKRIFKKDTFHETLLNFNSESEITYDAVKGRKDVKYFMRLERYDYLKDKGISIYYPFVIKNDSLFFPYDKYRNLLIEYSDTFISLIKKFEDIGQISHYYDVFYRFKLQKDTISISAGVEVIKDSFRIRIEINDDLPYENFLESIKTKIKKSYRLLTLCLKNKTFIKEIKEESEDKGFDFYRVSLTLKEGYFPPNLKKGEPIIPVVIVRKGKKPRLIVYYLNEKSELVRVERKF